MERAMKIYIALEDSRRVRKGWVRRHVNLDDLETNSVEHQAYRYYWLLSVKAARDAFCYVDSMHR